ncbi:MAG: cytochrome c oxidase subunit II [Aquihabitans sp.]
MTGHARSNLKRLAPIAFGLVLLATGCAHNAPQDTLSPAGSQARTIDNLIMPVFAISGVVFVLILGGAAFVAWKFRARDDADFDEFPEQVHGNFRLEIGWTIVPAIILGITGLFTVVTILDLAEKPVPEALHVEVYGQQWWWEYRYDLNNDGKYDEIITANDLVIPADRDIALKIKSRDVIHSWWSPRLNGKKDAVPGRTHPLTLHADKPGEYLGQCTEFCGLSHAEMRIKVVAVSNDEFQAWANNQQKPFVNPTDETAIEGWKTFAGSCTSCHQIEGMADPGSVAADVSPSTAAKPFVYPKVVNQVAGVVPNLKHFMTRSTFAGAKFNLRKDTKECNALGETWASTDANIDKCLNRNDLEAWLRNPPAMKAMKPGAAMSPMSRGMPNLNLTEDQIDQLVAFLITLK